MHYRYVESYTVNGIVLTDEIEVLHEAITEFRMVLTPDVNPYLVDADKSDAEAKLMLENLVGASSGSDHEARLDEALRKVIEDRQKRHKGPFLVFLSEGEVETTEPQAAHDWGDHIVWLNGGGNKAAVQARHREQVFSALSSLIIEVPDIGGIRKIKDSVVYVSEEGKPIYSRTMELSGQGYLSRRLTDETVQAVRNALVRLLPDRNFDRISRLLGRAFEREEDRFQAFLSAWSALEIFVNKVFPAYEARFFDVLKDSKGSKAQQRYLDRIKDVMRDKYGPADKFAAIAFQLSPEEADGDLALVGAAKKTRDGIAHGEAFEDSELPLESTRTLAQKYIRLHLHQDS